MLSVRDDLRRLLLEEDYCLESNDKNTKIAINKITRKSSLQGSPSVKANTSQPSQTKRCGCLYRKRCITHSSPFIEVETTQNVSLKFNYSFNTVDSQNGVYLFDSEKKIPCASNVSVDGSRFGARPKKTLFLHPKHSRRNKRKKAGTKDDFFKTNLEYNTIMYQVEDLHRKNKKVILDKDSKQIMTKTLVYLSYEEIQNIAFKRCYDVLLASAFIFFKRDEEMRSKKELSKLHGDTLDLDRIFKHTSKLKHIPLIIDEVVTSHALKPVCANSSQLTARKSKRKTNKTLFCDYVVDYPSKKTFPTTAPVIEKHNYRKSKSWRFYESFNDDDKRKWYHCIHQDELLQQQNLKKKKSETKNPTKSPLGPEELFDFSNFSILDPKPEDIFIEQNHNRCCYCGLEWQLLNREERVTHIRRHLISWPKG